MTIFVKGAYSVYNSIALCGGGGKGAYQIGVMKALNEKGFLRQFANISGTSVGALNAVLFAIGDMELAESVWLKYVNPNVMIKNFDAKRYEISRDALKSMIRFIGLNRLKDIPLVYAYAHNLRLNKPEPFLLNGRSEADITTILLASSAIPVAYSPVEFESDKYIDGGYTALGNHPLQILVDQGVKDIILVSLDYRFNPYTAGKSTFDCGFNMYERFPGIDFEIIKPSLDIGHIFDGTIDFKPESIRKRIALGYNDAKQIICQKKEVNKGMDINVNDKIRKLAREVLKSSQDFEDFVSISSFRLPNWKGEPIRAGVFWDTIFEFEGWIIEWHCGLIKKHYRIIDPKGKRRAWVMNPDDLIQQLILFGHDRK